VLRIQVARYEKMPLELQRTLERKPDQLLKITDTQGDTFLLHLEFQLADEPDMVNRMLEYRGILRRKFGLPVEQHVFFLADTVPNMPTRIKEKNLVFSFGLIQLSRIDYQLFLRSDRADEVVFAVLADFGNTNPQQAASQILERLTQTSTGPLELSRHLQQLRILANLRRLSPFIEQIMDSITQYIKEEDDFLFKKGELKGKQEGELKGKLEGELKGKQEAIVKFLKDGILSGKQLASYFDVSEEFVENLRRQLNG